MSMGDAAGWRIVHQLSIRRVVSLNDADSPKAVMNLEVHLTIDCAVALEVIHPLQDFVDLPWHNALYIIYRTCLPKWACMVHIYHEDLPVGLAFIDQAHRT